MSDTPQTPGPGPVSPGSPLPKRSWGRRLLSAGHVAAFASLGVIAGLAAAGGIGLWWMDTDSGRAFATRQAEANVPGLKVEGLAGLPFHPRVTRATLVDVITGKPWLTVEDAALDWRLLPLAHRELAVDTLSAKRIWVAQPAPSLEPPPDGTVKDDANPLTLPFSITLARLDLPRIDLAPNLAGGQGAALSTSGTVRLGPTLDGDSRLTLTQLDGGAAHGDLTARFTAPGLTSPGSLTLELQGQEEAGGLVARLAGHPELGPLALSLKGDGPLDRFQAHLELKEMPQPYKAADGATVTPRAVTLVADVGLARPQGKAKRMTLALKAAPGRLLADNLAQMAGDAATVQAAATLADDGTITLESLDLGAAFGRLTAKGNLKDKGGDLTLRLMPAAPGALSPVAPGLALGGLDAVLHTTDPAAGKAGAKRQRTVSADLTVEDLGYNDAHVRHLTATTTLREDGNRLLLDLAAKLQGLSAPGLPPALTDHADLALTGALNRANGDILVDKLDLTGGMGHVTGSGSAQGWGRQAKGSLRLTDGELATLMALTGVGKATPAATPDAKPAPEDAITGHVAATVEGTVADGVVDGTLAVQATDLRTGQPTEDALLAGRAEINGRVRASLDGKDVAVSPLTVRTGAVDLSGTVTLKDNTLTADLKGNGQVVGNPASVAAHVVKTGPHLTVRDLAAALGPNTLQGGLEADLDRQVATGKLAATFPDLSSLGALAGTRLAGRAKADIVLGASTRAPVRPARQTKARPGKTGKGPTAPTAAPPATTTATASGPKGGQAVDLKVTLDDLVVEDQRIHQATLDGRIDDLLGSPRPNVTLMADGIEAGQILVNKVAAAWRGTLGEGDLTLAVDGTTGVGSVGRRRAFQVEAAGHLTQPPEPASPKAARAPTLARLDQLDGRLDQTTLKLAAPATITVAKGSIAVKGLDVALGTGRIRADLALNGKEVTAQVEATALPLALAALADPALTLAGTLDAKVTANGTAANPTADATLSIHGLSMQQLAVTLDSGATQPPGAAADADGKPVVSATVANNPANATGTDTTPVKKKMLEVKNSTDRRLNADATLTAAWRNGRLHSTLAARTADGAVDLTADADTPLALNPETMAPVIQGPVSAKINGRTELSRYNDFMAASAQRMGGKVSVDLAVAGTVADPKVTGAVDLMDAKYENGGTGTQIFGLNAHLVGDARGLAIEKFHGSTADGGSVDLGGRINLGDPNAQEKAPILDLHVTTDNARLLRTDPITAWVDSDLTLKGLMNKPDLAGTVRLRETWVGLPDKPPADVADLPVRYVNGRPRQPQAPMAAAGGGLLIHLKVDITARNRIYVQGRGLTAEFAADMQARGTSADPQLTGRVYLVKGDFSAQGQTFTLTKSDITFTGDSDPLLDVSASSTKADFTAILNITGRLSKPTVALTSDPPRPQDEVLSRLLFDRPISQISALEALQLAQGVAQLSGVLGSGPGIMDNVKRSLGVDRLEFSSAAVGSSAFGTVTAGRYINSRTYIGVSQSVGGTGTNVTLEYALTSRLRLNGAVGSTDDTVGLKYQWDY
ncbi:translocation/assembly module TamB domain-containing protein [Nitrospirillum sp. BR 11828]|uniref:translocation/assembly module TamB domain-containing protein n=1 Tax=Nitrospirillum sp. BR 11828 TaxID=3104325 RepID=UPI002ACA8819|nr:translocation/assembly module TamB domain-containing protein [Nitrospirillum sp. BR 11828]MDZ5647142.1 translocation/assembly module TamB domain-containing protein [Nitrospirillum sp. BR 11828]